MSRASTKVCPSLIFCVFRKLSEVTCVSGKYHVDDYMRATNQPGTFVYTGNFYENMVFRGHMKYNSELDRVEFRQPIIKETTQCGKIPYFSSGLSTADPAPQ